MKNVIQDIKNFIIFISLSFIIDLLIHLIFKFSLGKIVVYHGLVYLIYGGITLISLMIFDSAHIYTDLHNKKHVLPLPKKARIKDIVYAILGGFFLITLEMFF